MTENERFLINEAALIFRLLKLIRLHEEAAHGIINFAYAEALADVHTNEFKKLLIEKLRSFDQSAVPMMPPENQSETAATDA